MLVPLICHLSNILFRASVDFSASFTYYTINDCTAEARRVADVFHRLYLKYAMWDSLHAIPHQQPIPVKTSLLCTNRLRSWINFRLRCCLNYCISAYRSNLHYFCCLNYIKTSYLLDCNIIAYVNHNWVAVIHVFTVATVDWRSNYVANTSQASSDWHAGEQLCRCSVFSHHAVVTDKCDDNLFVGFTSLPASSGRSSYVKSTPSAEFFATGRRSAGTCEVGGAWHWVHSCGDGKRWHSKAAAPVGTRSRTSCDSSVFIVADFIADFDTGDCDGGSGGYINCRGPAAAAVSYRWQPTGSDRVPSYLSGNARQAWIPCAEHTWLGLILQGDVYVMRWGTIGTASAQYIQRSNYYIRHDMLMSLIVQQFVLLLLIQKTYQFINVVNGVSHSHKTANIFFFHLT